MWPEPLSRLSRQPGTSRPNGGRRTADGARTDRYSAVGLRHSLPRRSDRRSVTSARGSATLRLDGSRSTLATVRQGATRRNSTSCSVRAETANTGLPFAPSTVRAGCGPKRSAARGCACWSTPAAGAKAHGPTDPSGPGHRALGGQQAEHQARQPERPVPCLIRRIMAAGSDRAPNRQEFEHARAGQFSFRPKPAAGELQIRAEIADTAGNLATAHTELKIEKTAMTLALRSPRNRRFRGHCHQSGRRQQV